jgi:hypothetical protein
MLHEQRRVYPCPLTVADLLSRLPPLPLNAEPLRNRRCIDPASLWQHQMPVSREWRIFITPFQERSPYLLNASTSRPGLSAARARGLSR